MTIIFLRFSSVPILKNLWKLWDPTLGHNFYEKFIRKKFLSQNLVPVISVGKVFVEFGSQNLRSSLRSSQNFLSKFYSQIIAAHT